MTAHSLDPDLDTCAEPEFLYRLYYRCADACQDPDDPYGRKPTHRCYEVIAYAITKVTATRIYFRDGYDRRYFIDRAKFAADGRAYHCKLAEVLHLAPPEIPGRTRVEPKSVSELRREMADAHPDRGGNRDTFQEARSRYLAAKARTA